MWHVIRYVAPADWETTSLTQHFGHEVPILPLMKFESREKTHLPLNFYFFFPLFSSLCSFTAVSLSSSSYLLHILQKTLKNGVPMENKIK